LRTREVLFDEYCPKCKHYNKGADEDPCWDCLNQGWNIDSHKPTMFEPSDEEEFDGNKRSLRSKLQDI